MKFLPTNARSAQLVPSMANAAQAVSSSEIETLSLLDISQDANVSVKRTLTFVTFQNLNPYSFIAQFHKAG